MSAVEARCRSIVVARVIAAFLLGLPCLPMAAQDDGDPGVRRRTTVAPLALSFELPVTP